MAPEIGGTYGGFTFPLFSTPVPPPLSPSCQTKMPFSSLIGDSAQFFQGMARVTSASITRMTKLESVFS
jgi:hypothetical protein